MPSEWEVLSEWRLFTRNPFSWGRVCVCGLCRLMSYSPASARHCVMENAIWIVFPSKLGITMLLLCRLHIAFSFTILSLSGCDHIWCDLCPVFLGRGGITFTATGWPAPRPWNERGRCCWQRHELEVRAVKRGPNTAFLCTNQLSPRWASVSPFVK